MKTTLFTAALAGAMLMPPAFCHAARKPAASPTTATSEQQEAAYTQSIEKRVADILDLLAISDASKKAHVHDTLVGQYRALRTWHDANDAKLKDKEQAPAAKASLKTLHDDFLAKLSADLTPEQVEKVKDKMTYNKVEVTYNAYNEIIPAMTDEEKAQVLVYLKDAREEAIDGGSADEKSAIFKKYKGKINNYLTSKGIDVGKAYKDWGEKQKQNSSGKTTQPAD